MAVSVHLPLFLETRTHTESICKPLELEDYVVQPVEEVSPPKWHLGHTSWFFEELLLKPFLPTYKEFHTDFAYVFNSYYESLGKRVVRSNRGNLSRPAVTDVYNYRKYITHHMEDLLQNHCTDEMEAIVEIGIHHEKQHQELLLTDIKFILGNNPLLPAYSNKPKEHPVEKVSPKWITIPEGVYSIGHNPSDGFCYDNELGRHRVFLEGYQIANKLVTNGQYLDFINDGGYKNVLLWHSDGWEWKQNNNIQHPLYWHLIDGKWFHYTLNGLKKINPDAPLAHISYYEAFAFAQWQGCRLPTEAEWETAQQNFSWGTRWEWTESAYLPYPGYKKPEGAIGEYNGKFMVNQKVLRGNSIATPSKHSRPTYRNFFHPPLRWQYTGIRLAK